MFEAAAIYLLAINAMTWAAFAGDKRAAVRASRRTPERQLLMLAVLGGSPAALAAQQVLRHKTRKEPFRSSLWGIVAVHLGLLGWALYRLAR